MMLIYKNLAKCSMEGVQEMEGTAITEVDNSADKQPMLLYKSGGGGFWAWLPLAGVVYWCLVSDPDQEHENQDLGLPRSKIICSALAPFTFLPPPPLLLPLLLLLLPLLLSPPLFSFSPLLANFVQFAWILD